jgi:hypothetical protein
MSLIRPSLKGFGVALSLLAVANASQVMAQIPLNDNTSGITSNVTNQTVAQTPVPSPTPAAIPSPAPGSAPKPASTPAPRRATPPAPTSASSEAPFRPAAAPQSSEPQLYERASFIGVCRSSGAQPITVSADVTRTRYTGTIQPYTRLNLTGVIAYNSSGQVQYVQISQPTLGYVPTATLLTDCNAGPTPPNPTKGTCYLIRRSLAPNGLAAYESPGGAPQRYPNSPNGQQDGPASGSRVFFTNPATPSQNFNNRTFVRVYYTSLSGNDRLGWISQGPVGSAPGAPSSNFEPCR